jgi:hypothetical protein
MESPKPQGECNEHVFAAVAFAVSLIQPAAAVNFPSLTTTYVGSGVIDSGDINYVGEATSFFCSNVSGVSVQVRALVLTNGGTVAGSRNFHGTAWSNGHLFNPSKCCVPLRLELATGIAGQGVVNIEATNSAVFCTAQIVEAANAKPGYMSPLHLVRVNAHPGTVE